MGSYIVYPAGLLKRGICCQQLILICYLQPDYRCSSYSYNYGHIALLMLRLQSYSYPEVTIIKLFLKSKIKSKGYTSVDPPFDLAISPVKNTECKWTKSPLYIQTWKLNHKSRKDSISYNIAQLQGLQHVTMKSIDYGSISPLICLSLLILPSVTPICQST